MCTRCTKLDLSYRQRNVVNYMTTRLAIAFAAALALLCSACGQNTDAPSEASSAPAGPVLVISESTESSQQSSTIAGITPTTEMKGSGTAPGSDGTGSTAPNKSHEAGPTKPTSPVVPDKPAQTPQTDGSKSTTTSGTAFVSTTDKPQTTSTSRPTTTTATTTTTAAAKSPWAYPYDIPAMMQECREEIARVEKSTHVGWGWDDSLTKEQSSWDQPESTVLYTTYPDGFAFGDYVFDGDLKNYVFGELIPFYLRNQDQYAIKRCKIWFEPRPERPGDYNIYFLYRPDSV